MWIPHCHIKGSPFLKGKATNQKQIAFAKKLKTSGVCLYQIHKNKNHNVSFSDLFESCKTERYIWAGNI